MNVDDNVCVPDVFWQLRVIQRTPVFVPSSLWKKKLCVCDQRYVLCGNVVTCLATKNHD